MIRALIAAVVGLALFMTSADASDAVIIDNGLPEQACAAPAAAASRDHVKRVRAGIGNPDVCTFIISTGDPQR